jgi:hypothetical protein
MYGMKWLVPVMWASLVLAQDQPAFEAASVKASAAGDPGMSMRRGPDTSLSSCRRLTASTITPIPLQHG